MSRDALETLGTILTEDEGRDAVHVAVVAGVAGVRIYPGQDVGLFGVAGALPSTPHLGIVDPFLKSPIQPGERFWLFLYPRTITGLRHVWTHPAFGDVPQEPKSTASREASEAWLREFVANADCPDYDTVLAAASGEHVRGIEGYSEWNSGEAYSNDGESLFFMGRDAHSEIPPEFWDHVEIVTGKRIPHEKRASYFSCSC